MCCGVAFIMVKCDVAMQGEIMLTTRINVALCCLCGVIEFTTALFL